MHSYFLLILFLSLSLMLPAQENTTSAKNANRQQEVGLLFDNFNEFGISYRCGKEHAMWRFSLLNINLADSYETPQNTGRRLERLNWGVELGLGREYRNKLMEKLQLRYGFGIRGSYASSLTENFNNGSKWNETQTQEIGLGIIGIFGFNYLINEHILIGAEILPQLGYTDNYSEITYFPVNTADQINSVSKLGFELNSHPVLLSLMVRF